jgi:hypothetical protein
MSQITDLLARVDDLERKLAAPLVVADLPMAALQRKLESDWQPDTTSFTNLSAHGVLATQAGAWTTSTPGATTGTAFNAPTNGTYLCVWGASAMMTVGAAAGSVEAYVDGALRDTLTYTFNALSDHRWMGVRPFTTTLTAGAHYFAVKDITANLTSDAADTAFLAGVKIG